MRPLELLVFHRGSFRTVPLPATGDVGIGRDPENAVQVDDHSVSRRHATITIDDDGASIEDAGSVNGTILVRAEHEDAEPPIAADPLGATSKASIPVTKVTRINPGDSIYLGAAVLVLRKAKEARGPAMESLDRLVEQIAPTPIRILLVGETGVGKEVIAERIHALSPRASRPLVKVHCAGLSETLLESELFGHERGAFTGAIRERVGYIESANGGTLFLDEAGEMSAAVQVKLLRALEDGKIQRVGSNDVRPVDVRIVSATHRNLAKDVKAGRFRQDLYFRLNGITLNIPPLRERPTEIDGLAALLLERAAKKANRETPSIAASALERLRRHGWPGNVRELRQVMERALALSTKDVIEADAILLDESPPSSFAPTHGALKDDLAALERRRVEQALAACGGNQSRAAEMLGMPRRTLVQRLREWGITKPRAKT